MGIVSFYTAADKHLQFAFFSSYQTTLSVKNYCSADKKYKYIYEDEGQLKESFRLLRMLYTLIFRQDIANSKDATSYIEPSKSVYIVLS